ncbi:zinc transporter ZIP3 [Caerostris darwini]|uniref:Zinc transporter ZIP3 n=1 Tax=Caerostris darwini TaxID=1538125 RepID=A0AAV4VSD7_9ARAC|nr:zinc transporter ZIP3 [Caerostris darwini]
MPIIRVQLLSLMGLFVGMVLSFLLPYWWVNRKPDLFGGVKYELLVSLANCFSGGVFMATFFVGLMPEVRNLFTEVFKDYKVETYFPIAEFVIFLGFLVALGIEQSVLEHKEKKAMYSSVPSVANEENNKSERNTPPVSCALKEICDTNNLDYDSDNSARSTIKICNNRSDSESIMGSPVKFHNDSHHGHGHSHDIRQILQGENGIRLGMLLVSLGIHSLFEGLALGLQTSVPILVNLVVGVAVHELLVAFAMGVNISRLHLPVSTALKFAVIFSASIPAGQVKHFEKIGIILDFLMNSVSSSDEEFISVFHV